jgi:3-oxoacyl-[acyl-carrier protein] reductase
MADGMPMKNALITGGSRGIGAAICRVLAEADYNVYINYRAHDADARALRDAICSSGGRAQLLPFDVSNQASIVDALQSGSVSSLDVLVNNAGILRDNLLLGTSDKDWEDVISTNFLGMLNTFKSCLTALRSAPEATVVNIASISGFRGGKGQCSYAASKAMVIEWTRQMALQFGEESMRFFSISPGPVVTEVLRGTPFYQNPKARGKIPLNRFAEPDEIGQLVLYLLNDGGGLQNGFNWIADGGFTLSPKA